MYKSVKRFAGGIAIIISLSALTVSGCNEQKLNSTFRGDGIGVDGDVSDWQGSTQLYDRDNGVKLGVANDKENIYISVVVWGEDIKRKIMMGGVTMWLDAGIDRIGEIGIQFPMSMASSARGNDVLESSPSKNGRSGSESFSERDRRSEMIKEFIGNAKEFELIVGENKESYVYLLDEGEEKTGIKLCMIEKNRSIFYESKVPLRTICGPDYTLPVECSSEFGLKFKTGEIKGRMARPESEDMRGDGQRPGGMGGGRPGGGMGGGMGGGPPRGGMGGQADRPDTDPYEMKIKVILSTGKD